MGDGWTVRDGVWVGDTRGVQVGVRVTVAVGCGCPRNVGVGIGVRVCVLDGDPAHPATILQADAICAALDRMMRAARLRGEIEEGEIA